MATKKRNKYGLDAYQRRTAYSAAKRVFDLRDCVPASDEKLWRVLDKMATRLSNLAIGPVPR